MKVTLLNYTPDARELLLLTKQTRLTQDAGALEAIKAWPEERKAVELAYMLGTIESSWEFVDYVFHISGVSRAFTHQFVRTRQGSYAQESQRTVDKSGFDYVTPASLEGDALEAYRLTMRDINDGYEHMRELDVPPQDARGVLPTNVATAITAKFDLRTLSHMAELRLCTRTQGEYQDVFRAMRAEVIKVHPWAEPFLRVACARRGVCAFPNFTECPVKGPVFNPDTGERWDGAKVTGEYAPLQIGMRPATREEIQALWASLRYEARPQQGRPTTEPVAGTPEEDA